MRINDYTLIDVQPINAVPVHASAAVASVISACAPVTGVEGTTVSCAGVIVSAGAVGVESVEAVRVRAAAALALASLELDVRGYGAQQQDRARVEQAQDLQRHLMQDGEDSKGDTGSPAGVNGSNGTSGTNPFGPWDFRTSSPPG